MTFDKNNLDDISPPGKRGRSIGILTSREAMEQTLHGLRAADLTSEQISIVVRDEFARDEAVRRTTRDDKRQDESDTAIGAALPNRAEAANPETAGTADTAASDLRDWLTNSCTLMIAEIGLVRLAGTTAVALATALSLGVLGATVAGLTGGLIGLGISKATARACSRRLAQGEYLILIDGAAHEVTRAGTVLRQHGVTNYAVYDVLAYPASDIVIAYGIVDVITDDASTDLVLLPLQRQVAPIAPTPTASESNPESDRPAVADFEANPQIVIVDRREQSEARTEPERPD